MGPPLSHHSRPDEVLKFCQFQRNGFHLHLKVFELSIGAKKKI